MTLAFALTTLALALSAPAPARPTPPPGVWANPARSVHVAFKRCGPAICGDVVWANEKAKDDAARGGADRLVGSRLFDGFVEEEPGYWSGEVFIPDIGQSVAGTITRVDARTLRGEGCLFAGFGCRTQDWTRIR